MYIITVHENITFNKNDRVYEIALILETALI